MKLWLKRKNVSFILWKKLYRPFDQPNKRKKCTSVGLGIVEGAINTFYKAFTHNALFTTTPLPPIYLPCDLRGKRPLTSTEAGLLGQHVRSLHVLRCIHSPSPQGHLCGKNLKSRQPNVASRKDINTTRNSKSIYKYEHLPIF